MFERRMTVSAWVRALQYMVIALVVVGPGAVAHAQDSTTCLRDIERWMREYQARFVTLRGYPVQWPNCCQSGSTPLYPPDDYYDDALKDNSDLAVKLVEAFRYNICHSSSQIDYRIYAEFVKEDYINITGRCADACSSGYEAIPEYTSDDAASICNATVTKANFCGVYAQIREFVRKLRAIRQDLTLEASTRSALGGHNTWPPDQAPNPYPNPAPNCTLPMCHATAATALSRATCQLTDSWGASSYTTPATSSVIQVWEAAQRLTDGSGSTCWGIQFERTRGRAKGNLSLAKRGTATIYLWGTKHWLYHPDPSCDGNVPADAPAITLNSTWRSIGTTELGNAAYQSDLYGDGTTMDLWFSETNLPNCGSSTPASGVTKLEGQRGWAIRGAVAIQEPEWDTRPDPARKCGDDCGQCIPGQPKVALGGDGNEGSPKAGASVYWPLGRYTDAYSAGGFQMRSDDLSAAAITPAAIASSRPCGTNECYQDVSNSNLPIYQFNLPFAVADIRPQSSGSANTVVSFYLPSQGSVPGGSTIWVPTSGQSPFAQTTLVYAGSVSAPDPCSPGTNATVKRVTITHTGVGAGVWEIIQLNDDWLIRSGVSGGSAASQIAHCAVEESGTDDIIATRQVYESNGTSIAVRQVERWHEEAWGWELTRQDRGATGALLTAYREYYTASGDNYGRLRKETNPYGGWTVYEYDSVGRVIKTITGFKHAVESAGENANRVFASAYHTIDVDQDSTTDLIEEQSEKLQGSLIARTFFVDFGANRTRGGATGRCRWVIRCASAAAPSNLTTFLRDEYAAQMATNGWGTTANDVTESIRETDSPFRTLSTLRKDGTLTWSQYTQPSGVAWRVTTYSGRMSGTSSPYVVNGTKRETDKNEQGTVLSTTTKDISTSTEILIGGSSSTGYIDPYGRAQRVTDALTGRYSETSYSCCGVEYEVDELGIRTDYEYDALKRVTKVIRQVGPVSGSAWDKLTSVTTYDAAGRVLTEGRIPVGGTAETLRTNVYDQAGRLTSSYNSLGSTLGATTYTETIDSNGYVIRTETFPDPDGSGSLAAPKNTRAFYRDGSLYTVNIPFYDASSASAPEWHDYGTGTVGGVTMVGHVRYASSSLSIAYPYTATWSDALGRVRRSDASLTTSTVAAATTEYNSAGWMVTHKDPDDFYTFSVSGVGIADGARLFGGSVPSGMQTYFQGRWTATIIDASGDGNITLSATSGKADRISLTGSWMDTRVVGGVTKNVHRSATIQWTTDTSTSAFVETSRTDSLLDGSKSWTTAFDLITEAQTTYSRTDGRRDSKVIAYTGAHTVTREEWGRHKWTERTHATSSFGGRTESEYDARGRVIKNHFLRYTGGSWNSSYDDKTEMSYHDTLDWLMERTDPSPVDGTSTVGRLVSSYSHDYLGRVTTVGLSGGKETATTYNARGQVTSVSGFGVNPVEYQYDPQGRMTALITAGNAGTATTAWSHDGYSGRLTEKYYEGSTGADLAYTYEPSGRLATRTSARGIVTTYGYDNTGTLNSITYSDTTPDVSMAFDRRGRMVEVHDAAGLRTLVYSNDGRVESETFTSDSGPSLLDGVTITNALTGTSRSSHLVEAVSTTMNFVEFEHDSDNRINRVIKNNADVLYDYDQFTGQVVITTSRHNTGSAYEDRIYAARDFDRLGRLTDINSLAANTAGTILESRSHTMDIYGRRTEVASAATHGHNWEYGYDDMGQLISAGANFGPEPNDAVPGGYYEYAYDDIGNRLSTTQGSVGDTYTNYYTPNALNQYTERDLHSKFEVSGHSPIDTVLVNDNTATRFFDSGSNLLYDGFFHSRVELDASAGPVRGVIEIQEVPGAYNAYEVFAGCSSEPLNETFTYDADGNLASDGIWEYTWDAENRLKRMNMKSEFVALLVEQSELWVRLEFEYDFMGRRISKRLLRTGVSYQDGLSDDGIAYEWTASYWTKYVYDTPGWNLSASLKCDAEDGEILSPDQSFAWGPDLSGSEQGAGGIGGLAIYLDDDNELGGGSGMIGPMFPVYDGNGNITRLYSTAVDGNDVPIRKAEWRYGPFGESRGQTGPQAARFPFRWSTKFTDNETGLVYYGYRYYSASLGRWMSRDPLEEVADESLQVFVGNSPIGNVDILGLYVPPPNSTITPYELGWEWLTGNGPSERIFGPGDYMTELLRSHDHVKNSIREMRSEVILRCEKCTDRDFSRSFNYRLDGWGGILKFMRDYTALGTGGLTGNLAVTFLGSYGLTITTKNIRCSEGKATLKMEAWNTSKLSSGTRPPLIGYWDWWQKYVAPRIDALATRGPMSPIKQVFRWEEEITFRPRSCCGPLSQSFLPEEEVKHDR